MRSPVLLACAFLGAALASIASPDASEVHGLGAADATDLGEETGGFFSALMTSGSFTMMQVCVCVPGLSPRLLDRSTVPQPSRSAGRLL